MHRLTSLSLTIFFLTIHFTTPILAVRGLGKVDTQPAARVANIAQIEAIHAAAADIQERPPIIAGPCSLEARKDRPSHRTPCIPADCYSAGGRCVSIRSRATFRFDCMKHVVDRPKSVEASSSEEVVHHEWSRRRKGLPYLNARCQGCVCKNVKEAVAATNVKGIATKNMKMVMVVKKEDVAEESKEKETGEERKDSDLDSDFVPDGFADDFDQEAYSKYPSRLSPIPVVALPGH